MAWRDLPSTTLRSEDGATAVILDHGAQLVSWRPAAQTEALFMSDDSRFAAGDAIRGGVPIIFPQFAERGPLKKHGFARNCLWQRAADVAKYVEEDAARTCYFLDSASCTSADWPHQFRLEYVVIVQGSSLSMALSVINTDVHSWSFHAALHTYLRVKDIAAAHISGLAAQTFHDKVKEAQVSIQTQPLLPVIGELDRIYVDVHAPLHLHDGQARLQITQDGEGFSDAVVWNPGAVKARSLADLTLGAENHFVCIEAGAIMQAIELAPGAQWTGRQILRRL